MGSGGIWWRLGVPLDPPLTHLVNSCKSGGAISCCKSAPGGQRGTQCAAADPRSWETSNPGTRKVFFFFIDVYEDLA